VQDQKINFENGTISRTFNGSAGSPGSLILSDSSTTREVVRAILFAMLSIAVSQDEEESLMSVKGSR